MPRKQQEDQNLLCAAYRRLWQQLPFEPSREDGQAMLEMTVGMIFLLLLIVALFEMTMVFYTYIALLNASREGAVYASAHPNMSAEQYAVYESVTSAEALASGLITDAAHFQIDAPVTPDGTDPLDPIIVRVHYQLINPTQGIVLPMLGRMGLFTSAWIMATTEMPIR